MPTWVRPPLRAVASTEEFLLWLYGRTRAPAALGAWSALSWLAAADGDQTPGPLTRVGLPREVVAWAELRVATRISNGAPYPPATWWARHGIEQADRMALDQ